MTIFNVLMSIKTISLSHPVYPAECVLELCPPFLYESRVQADQEEEEENDVDHEEHDVNVDAWR